MPAGKPAGTPPHRLALYITPSKERHSKAANRIEAEIAPEPIEIPGKIARMPTAFQRLPSETWHPLISLGCSIIDLPKRVFRSAAFLYGTSRWERY
jgi:hypothetical protein